MIISLSGRQDAVRRSLAAETPDRADDARQKRLPLTARGRAAVTPADATNLSANLRDLIRTTTTCSLYLLNMLRL